MKSRRICPIVEQLYRTANPEVHSRNGMSDRPRRPVKNRRPVAGTIHKITYTNTEPELAFEARTTCHL